MQEVKGYVHLDRITIVGTVIDVMEWWTLTKLSYSMQNKINFVSTDPRDTENANSWRLSENGEIGTHAPYVSLLPSYHNGQVDDTIKVRLEMNPVYQTTEMLGFIQNIILSNLEHKKFSRVDFAFNTTFDLHLIEHDLTTKKSIYYGRDGLIETKQWGVRASTRQVIVYDKAAEQDIDEPWWRYEIRLSGDRLRDWQDVVQETINAMVNPVGISDVGMKIYASDSLSSSSKMNLLAYLNEGDEVFKIISRPTKYRMLKELRDLDDEPDVIEELVRTFSQIWDNSTQSIAEQLQAYGNEPLEQLMRNDDK